LVPEVKRIADIRSQITGGEEERGLNAETQSLRAEGTEKRRSAEVEDCPCELRGED
jgi:hypothetical protein